MEICKSCKKFFFSWLSLTGVLEYGMDPASQGRVPTRAEQRENRGNGRQIQIAATTDAKQPRPP